MKQCEWPIIINLKWLRIASPFQFSIQSQNNLHGCIRIVFEWAAHGKLVSSSNRLWLLRKSIFSLHTIIPTYFYIQAIAHWWKMCICELQVSASLCSLQPHTNALLALSDEWRVKRQESQENKGISSFEIDSFPHIWFARLFESSRGSLTNISIKISVRLQLIKRFIHYSSLYCRCSSYAATWATRLWLQSWLTEEDELPCPHQSPTWQRGEM